MSSKQYRLVISSASYRNSLFYFLRRLCYQPYANRTVHTRCFNGKSTKSTLFSFHQKTVLNFRTSDCLGNVVRTKSSKRPDRGRRSDDDREKDDEESDDESPREQRHRRKKVKSRIPDYDPFERYRDSSRPPDSHYDGPLPTYFPSPKPPREEEPTENTPTKKK